MNYPWGGYSSSNLFNTPNIFDPSSNLPISNPNSVFNWHSINYEAIRFANQESSLPFGYYNYHSRLPENSNSSQSFSEISQVYKPIAKLPHLNKFDFEETNSNFTQSETNSESEFKFENQPIGYSKSTGFRKREVYCIVCGDQMTIVYNTGKKSCCESCKGFFKRTVRNRKTYCCSYDGKCFSSLGKRKCQACRFKRCVEVDLEDSFRKRRKEDIGGDMNHRSFDSIPTQPGPYDSVTESSHSKYKHRCPANLKRQAVEEFTFMSSVDTAIEVKKLKINDESCDVSSNKIEDCPSKYLNIDDTTCNSKEISHETKSVPEHMRDGPGYPWIFTSDNDDENFTENSSEPRPSLFKVEQMEPPQASTSNFNYSAICGDKGSHKLQDLHEVHRVLLSTESFGNWTKDAAMDFLRVEMVYLDVDDKDKVLTALCSFLEKLLYYFTEWGPKLDFFKNITSEDRCSVMKITWSEVFLIDFVQHYLLTFLNNSPLKEMMKINLYHLLDRLNLTEFRGRLHNLIEKLADLEMDNTDFDLLKILVLFNGETCTSGNSAALERTQQKICQLMFQYCNTIAPHKQDKFGQLLLRLPEVKFVACSFETVLQNFYSSGYIRKESLLAELVFYKHKACYLQSWRKL